MAPSVLAKIVAQHAALFDYSRDADCPLPPRRVGDLGAEVRAALARPLSTTEEAAPPAATPSRRGASR